MSPRYTSHLLLKIASGLIAISIIYFSVTGCNKYPDLIAKEKKITDHLAKPRPRPGSSDTLITGEAPVLDSIKINSVTRTSASISAKIVSSNGSDISETGVFFATHPGITENDQQLAGANSLTAISVTLHSLNENTTYYVRAYAKNTTGIGYSQELSFKTLSVADDPFDLNGTWKGKYGEVSSFCGVFELVHMNVSTNGNQFEGLVTFDYSSMRQSIKLTGVINSAGTELTVNPQGQTVYENPWIISGTKINGAIVPFVPAAPDTLIVYRTYEFTRE